MDHRFLCEQHREQFTVDTGLAIETWETGIKKGKALFDDEQFGEAIGFLGSSFDIADLLIDLNMNFICSGLNQYECYLLAGHGVAECFNRLNHKEFERHFLLKTHYRLMELLRGDNLSANVMGRSLELSLAVLKNHFDTYAEYEQIKDVFETDSNLWREKQKAVMH